MGDLPYTGIDCFGTIKDNKINNKKNKMVGSTVNFSQYTSRTPWAILRLQKQIYCNKPIHINSQEEEPIHTSYKDKMVKL